MTDGHCADFSGVASTSVPVPVPGLLLSLESLSVLRDSTTDTPSPSFEGFQCLTATHNPNDLRFAKTRLTLEFFEGYAVGPSQSDDVVQFALDS